MMNKKIAIVVLAILLLTCVALGLTACNHQHQLTHHQAIEPTCTQNGVGEYWSCECGQLFSDHDGAQVIAQAPILQATGHSFTVETVKAEALKTVANCQSKAVYYKSCVCGAISQSASDTFEFGEKDSSNHTQLDSFTYQVSDGDVHVKKHACCGAVANAEEACSGGNATCTEKAVCQHCGEQYGALANHNYVENVQAQGAKVSDADCENPAVYKKSCSACGALSEQTFTYQSAIGHNYTVWHKENATEHWIECLVCGGEQVGSREAHQTLAELDTDHDCSTEAVCECGYVVAQAHASHVSKSDTYQKTASTHWKVCTNNATCQAKVGEESHVADNVTDCATAHNCNLCEQSFTVGHEKGVSHAKVPATCTSEGTKAYYECVGCDKNLDENGNVIEQLTIEKIAHKYTNYISNDDETCLVDGTKRASCDYNCGTEDTIANQGSALGHAEDVEDIVWKWSAKDDGGYDVTATVGCTRCDQSAKVYSGNQVTVASEQTQAPSCTAVGKLTYTATITIGETQKSNTKVDDVAMLDHDYVYENLVYQHVEGTKTHKIKCEHCVNYSEPVDCTFTSSTTAPTCTAQGYTTHTCACGYSYDDSYVQANGHAYGEEVTYVWSKDYSTCTATRSCSCGDEQTATAVITSAVTQTATATLPEMTTYKATFSQEWAVAQTKEVKTGECLDPSQTDPGEW